MAFSRLHGAKANFTLRRGYPVLSNHERETAFALEARPGAFIFVGNGDSPGLHHPRYNFNDDVIPYGTSYWVRLVETAMAG